MSIGFFWKKSLQIFSFLQAFLGFSAQRRLVTDASHYQAPDPHGTDD